MQKNMTFFNDVSGEIEGHIIALEEMIEFWWIDHPDLGLIDGRWDTITHYVDVSSEMPIVRLRPEIIAGPSMLIMAADRDHSIVISGLPIPCTVTVDGNAYTIDDGEFEFTTDTTGTYKISVEAFPYIPTSWEVTAV